MISLFLRASILLGPVCCFSHESEGALGTGAPESAPGTTPGTTPGSGIHHAPNAPTGLLTDLMAVPLGIDSKQPIFNWIVNDADPNEVQSAYQLLVSSTRAKIDADQGDVWDSGKVESVDSSVALYNGPALAENSGYYWKVRTWDKEGAVSPYSKAMSFTTAVGSGWTADAIWAGERENAFVRQGRSDSTNVVFFRKSFTVDPSKSVERATVSVTARYPGFKGSSRAVTRQYAFKFSLNGFFVGVGPHFEGFDGKYFYNTFDVTDKLVAGENAMGAIVYVLQDKRFQAQLKIDYTDGSSQMIATDGSWKSMDGTAVFDEGNGSTGTDSYFTAMSENIDARIYPFGFDRPGFDDSGWLSSAVKMPIENLAPSPVDPVVQEEITPAKVVDKGNGNSFIDLGKEIVGGIRLCVNGVDGARLTVLYGEERSGENTVRWQMRTGNRYREYFTLKAGAQTVENFGMKNFRYIEVQNCPVPLTADNIRGIALHQAFDEGESYFVSDSQTLNDIYKFCKYSLKVTSQDLFVDSQSRERGPYEGDAYINGLSYYSFSRRYSLPRFSNEFLTYHPEWCTEYRQMNVMSYWEDYLYTGNLRAIAENYNQLTGKVLNDKLDSAKKLVRCETPSDNLVDWPKGERDGYVMTGYNTVINAFQYRAARNLAAMAKLLGRSADAQKYADFAETLKEGIAALYNAETGKMADGLDADGNLLTHSAQHASFFPLALGTIADPEQAAALADFLAGDGIKCSVYACQFLLDSLYAAGYGQAALDILTDTGIRSFAHLIYDLGATVTGEAWDPALKPNMTFSHAWGSAPGNVIVRDLCGIQPIEAGYSRVRVMPRIGDLTKISVKTPCIKGYVYMEIDRTDSAAALKMSVTLPVGVTGEIHVPAVGTEGSRVLVDGVSVDAARQGEYLTIDNVGSGRHTFVIPA